MIKKIEIENFRCFEKTEIEGFRRINLIGGKNNVGKTALLEAMMLGASPTKEFIDFILSIVRPIDYRFINSNFLEIWKQFFFDNSKGFDTKGIIKLNDTSIGDIILSLHYNNETQDFFTNYKLGKDDFNNIHNLINGTFILESNVTKEGKVENVKTNLFLTNKYLLFQGDNKIHIDMYLNPANSNHIITGGIAEAFDNADLQGKKELILEGLRIIEPEIEDAFTRTSPTNSIYIKKNKKEQIINLYGDAFRRIASIIINSFNYPFPVILIDEIENGLHYTMQKDFWKYLFKIAKQFNIQIFATTHSIEMIKSFSEVLAEEENKDEGVYVELAKTAKTKRIRAILHNSEQLNSELETGFSIRGEFE